MLIDDLIQATYIDNVLPDKFDGLQTMLRGARKFELAPDFAAAAETLAANLGAVANALPYCRLPFKVTWIEVAQQHRPRFAAAPIHVPAMQHVPKRVGFLCLQKPEDPAQFVAFQYWTLRDTEIPQAGFVAMAVDPGQADLVPEDVKLPERKPKVYFDCGVSPEWLKSTPHVQAVLSAVLSPTKVPYIDNELLFTPPMEQISWELGIADWSGESMYLLAVLALLNTVNAVETKRVENSKLNKARARRGQYALANHEILTIAPRLKKRIIGDYAAHGHRALRGHLVRGHWKVRKTGVFFWHAHARGEGAPDDKRYKVK